MKGLIHTLAAAVFLLAWVPPATASLVGTTVTIETFEDGFPAGSATVIPDGTPTPEAFIDPVFTYNIEDDFIDLVCEGGAFCPPFISTIAGTYLVTFSGLDWGGTGALVDAVLDPTSNCVNCNASITGLGPSGFGIAFGPALGWGVFRGDSLRVNLTSTHTAVPEPSSLALLGMGLLLLAFGRRRVVGTQYLSRIGR